MALRETAERLERQGRIEVRIRECADCTVIDEHGVAKRLRIFAHTAICIATILPLRNQKGRTNGSPTQL
jgi:hypothetical protein